MTLIPTLERTVQVIGPLFARKMAESLPIDQRDPNPSRDRRAWIESKLIIAPKEAGYTIPLRFNHVQQLVWETWRARGFRGIRQSILKFRQGGISTLVLAYFFEEALNVGLTNVMIVSKNEDDTLAKLRTIRLFMERLDLPTPKNKREDFIQLANGSTFRVETGQKADIGRGTTLHKVLLSEAAYYRTNTSDRLPQILAGITQAVPIDGDIIEESTANGMGSAHQQQYADIKNGGAPGWTTFFLPWFAHEEYRIALDADEPFEATAEELVVQERFGLTAEQLKWRRQKRGELKDRFPQEHPETEEEAFLHSGRARFDRAALIAIAKGNVQAPLEVLDVGGGQLRIYAFPDSSRHYSVGADTAEGIAGGDYDSAHVLDDQTGVEVATLFGLWQPHVFADHLYDLGKRFAWAMLGVERNNHGHAVLQRLVLGGHRTTDASGRTHVRGGYPETRLYRHYTEGEHAKFGWPTNAVTKPQMETGLAELINEAPGVFVEAETVLELLSIVYLDDGTVGAQPGSHDDRFVSRGIAEMVRRFGGVQGTSGAEYDEEQAVSISPF